MTLEHASTDLDGDLKAACAVFLQSPDEPRADQQFQDAARRYVDSMRPRVGDEIAERHGNAVVAAMRAMGQHRGLVRYYGSLQTMWTASDRELVRLQNDAVAEAIAEVKRATLELELALKRAARRERP